MNESRRDWLEFEEVLLIISGLVGSVLIVLWVSDFLGLI